MKKCLKTILTLAMTLLAFQLGAQTFEGKGAASPEEAVSNYLNALKKCDYNEIISCYSVETFVDNYNIEQNIQKLNAATPLMKMIDSKNNLLKQTGKYEVIDSITKIVKYQIWNLCDNNFYKDGKIVMVKDSAKNVAKNVLPSNADKRLSKINFTNKFIPIDNFFVYYSTSILPFDTSDYEDVIEPYKKKLNQHYDQTKKIYGCDDIRDVIVNFTIEGTKYYLFTETIKYGNKWYLSSNQGFMASLVGLSTTNGCIIREEEL